MLNIFLTPNILELCKGTRGLSYRLKLLKQSRAVETVRYGSVYLRLAMNGMYQIRKYSYRMGVLGIPPSKAFEFTQSRLDHFSTMGCG